MTVDDKIAELPPERQEKIRARTEELLSSNDLCARLRAATTTVHCHGADEHYSIPVCLEAADEIERLRGLIAAHNASCAGICGRDDERRCFPYRSRGLQCPDCPRDWMIAAERAEAEYQRERAADETAAVPVCGWCGARKEDHDDPECFEPADKSTAVRPGPDLTDDDSDAAP